MANNYSPVQTSQNFSRFHTVSPWGNVGQVLGGNRGTITSAAIVAYPSAISVFFVAQLGGVYRLWHTVRFSSDGSWRPAKDVLTLSGEPAIGRTSPFFVTAGVCPELAPPSGMNRPRRPCWPSGVLPHSCRSASSESPLRLGSGRPG
jgi:hypothetical protein